MGVVGMLPAALTEDTQRHKRHNNIKMGTLMAVVSEILDVVAGVWLVMTLNSVVNSLIPPIMQWR